MSVQIVIKDFKLCKKRGLFSLVVPTQLTRIKTLFLRNLDIEKVEMI